MVEGARNSTFTIHHSAFVFAVAVALAGVTVAVYAPVYRFNFVNYDDPEYVTGNPHVRRGLSADGVIWAFTRAHSANWHPITWLSHMIDCELFGVAPGPHHLVNVTFHIANTLLLLLFLTRATGEMWPATFAAALFAVHPMHVESVAWIAERKDVLSAFFFLLALLSYLSYARRPSLGRSLLVTANFALALMAKPMAVTLPFVLLLLDVWPLRRGSWFVVRGSKLTKSETKNQEPRTRNPKPLVREKLPLFALAAVVSVITYVVQRQSGAVVSTENLPLGFRLANALVAYAWYIQKTVWPIDLAVFYPIPTELTLAPIAWAAVLIVGATLAALRMAPRHPYVLVGWLWFLGTLVPVIGLIKAGEQSTADRFTYIPHIGLFMLLAWLGRDIVARGRARAAAVLLTAAASLTACAVASRAQLLHWHDCNTLFRHALAVTDDNYVAHVNLGQTLSAERRYAEALEHFNDAVRLRPGFARARVNLAATLAAVGDHDAALREYAEALRLDPTDEMAHFNRGLLLAERGASDEALAAYTRALQLKPDYAKAHLSMGIALAARGQREEAISHYREALRLEPESASAHTYLAIALEESGRRAEAVTHYAEAVRLAPNEPRVQFNLGSVLEQEGRTADALRHYRNAVNAQSDFAAARLALGNLLAKTGDREAAVAEVRAALKARPNWPEAEAALAALVPPHADAVERAP